MSSVKRYAVGICRKKELKAVEKGYGMNLVSALWRHRNEPTFVIFGGALLIVVIIAAVLLIYQIFVRNEAVVCGDQWLPKSAACEPQDSVPVGTIVPFFGLLDQVHIVGEPYRIATRAGVLTCRACRRQTGLTVGTVMERSRTPLSTWFWAAYLVASQTKGMSAVQFQRQLGLTRYETAFGILHKLRAGMVRPDRDRIGAREGEYVEVDECYVGGRTRGEGRGVHYKTLVAAAVEVRSRKPGTAQDKRKDGRYAGRVRLAVAAPIRCVASSIVPSCRGRGSSPTIGAHMAACGRAASITTPLPNAATPRWPKSFCRSSTSSSAT